MLLGLQATSGIELIITNNKPWGEEQREATTGPILTTYQNQLKEIFKFSLKK